MSLRSLIVHFPVALCFVVQSNVALSQGEPSRFVVELMAMSADELADEAARFGDAKRGAVLFYQPQMACRQCHSIGDLQSPLGPNLLEKRPESTDAFLVESVLHPSKFIRNGYEAASVVDVDGKVTTGILVEETPQKVVLREPRPQGKVLEFDRDDLDGFQKLTQSVMPDALVSLLASRQQFLDLVKYLIEIRDGGLLKAKELEPPSSLYAIRIPEYEKDIDHAGMIEDLDKDAFKRGQAIYNRLCINCHGTPDKPGSLPTSLKFASGKFRSGHDPYTMYQTLTRGFGMMVAQVWMVPQQKYDVIHYVREAYLKSLNPTQYHNIDEAYLEGLPKGSSRGPEPVHHEPWVTMDYGPSLVNTYEFGSDASNFAYKGIAVRLDAGPGGVSRGQSWMVFDHDTLRVAGAWTGQGFIDWQGIHFNGRHGIHPRVQGDVQFANPTGPGWASPDEQSFVDPRFRGRDDRPYGPLPRKWAHFKGLYHHGQKTIVEYTVGDTRILEMPGLASFGVEESTAAPVFTRTFNIGPRSHELLLQVAREPERSRILFSSDQSSDNTNVLFGVSNSDISAPTKKTPELRFDGKSFVEVTDSKAFNTTSADFSITARVRTRKGGTIFSRTVKGPKWVPDGQTLFIRNGQLCFDIGWVGVVQSRKSVADGRWHNVAMTWNAESEMVRLFVDGKAVGSRELTTEKALRESVLRIGFTNDNFPGPWSTFDGDLQNVRFFQRELSAKELKNNNGVLDERSLVAHWMLTGDFSTVDSKEHDRPLIADGSGNAHHGTVRGQISKDATASPLQAGIRPAPEGIRFGSDLDGRLLLTVPAGDDPLRFTLWMRRSDAGTELPATDRLHIEQPDQDLSQLTKGGPARWPVKLTTHPEIGLDNGPFAVDVLAHPQDNPWLAQMRLTGFDFLPGGDRVVVCSWDGDVWMVSGLSTLPGSAKSLPESPPRPQLTWQRIASGLFQPLGVKFVKGKIYVSCRDQIAILHDLNGDGETDFYENFNNDHQVTPHFHEFAMGLQTDEAGNFYYAKSARHALKAVVPHHGTLLRVPPDGSRTDILATGFRAANGVCLNPDGSFIVTDQEGHWNPKNRINWVREGGFYGNMFGYHDITDDSNEAMEQPLCWITNAFDRSPAELLWCDSDRWGPLQGSLLNLSYGYGKIFVVPHENINGQMQGGMCELPIPQFPTGLIRGRFNPKDGQLYSCGMFAWAGSQHQPGGFYRIRYTGKPAHLPAGLNAIKGGVRITFTDPVDAESAADPGNYRIKVWDLKRTASYGSKHYNERSLKVSSVSVSEDRRQVELIIPDIAPTWGMEIRYALKGANGETVTGNIHNTIHRLPE